MRLTRKTIWRLAGALLLLLVAAGIAAPYFNADRFGRRVQASLEKALDRRVEIGKVRLDLFGGPGFSISDVVIHDDPRMGIEPLAYVTSLETRISPASLWTGRLDFASLRLVEPSVNLVKPAAGPWNLEALLSRALAVPAAALPPIRVRGGRVNFKFGEVKSVFYLSDADIDIEPSGGDGGWGLRFSGEPARCDRPVRGLGRLTGKGRWRPDPQRGDRLDLTLELEKGFLEEAVALLRGRDPGIHALITARARLAGPIAGLEITGRARIEELRRSDLMPPYGAGWTFDYRGRLDLTTQRLELETSGTGPLALRFCAAGYLSQPRWGALLTLNKLPLRSATGLAPHFGLAVAEGAALDGEVSGAVGYSPESGTQGALLARDVVLKAPDSGPLRCARLPVLVEPNHARFGPATVEHSDRHELSMEGDYTWSKRLLGLRLATKSMPIAEPLWGAPPLLEHCRGGVWKGDLRCRVEGEGPPSWTGAIQVEDTQVAVPGLAAPVEILSARMVLKEGGAVMEAIRARAGSSDFEAHYRYQPRAARQHEFRVSAAQLDAAELERLLAPALDRRRGLLARTLRLGAVPLPDWLAARRAEGMFKIGSVSLGSSELASGLSGRLVWEGASAEISNLEAQVQGASVTGNLIVNLTRPTPGYHLEARFRNLPWSGGEWEGEGVVRTQGLGPDLLSSLRADGAFTGLSVVLAPEAEFDSVTGRLDVRFSRGAPRVEISDLRAVSGQQVFRGECRAQEDGRLSVEFSDGRKHIRLAGTLWPLQLEPVAR
ncbi:MAG: AsmA family protein [Acidobacteriota bacterium]